MGVVGAAWEPEARNWRDTGCRLHPACLSCPRETCVYDSPGGNSVPVTPLSARRVDPRREVALKSLDAGVSVNVVAERVGVSTRTVWRWQREAAGKPA